MLTRSKWCAIFMVVGLLCLAAPAALAGNLRILALGNLAWIIDDDTDDFRNPAHSAWVEEGYLDFAGEAYQRDYAANDIRTSRYGVVHFLKPLGQRNVLGGWASLDVKRRDKDNVAFPYVWTDLDLVANLQDAVKLNDQLALGGSVTYTPNPTSRKYEYDDGLIHEYIDKGAMLGLEGGLSYRPSEAVDLEFGVLSSSQPKSTVDVYEDGAVIRQDTYAYSSFTVHGKAGYTLSEQAEVAAWASSKTWNEDDNGTKSDGADTHFAVGGTYKPSERLLLAGGVETESETASGTTTTYTYLRGGAEYKVTDRLTLRGGVVRSNNNSTQDSVLNVTAGAGLALGPGQLDLYALVYHTDSDTATDYPKYSDFMASYTVKF